MSKYEELKKVIKEYESDTFYGGDLTDEQVTIIADGLIENLINNYLDGVMLSIIYEQNFDEDDEE